MAHVFNRRATSHVRGDPPGPPPEATAFCKSISVFSRIRIEMSLLISNTHPSYLSNTMKTDSLTPAMLYTMWNKFIRSDSKQLVAVYALFQESVQKLGKQRAKPVLQNRDISWRCSRQGWMALWGTWPSGEFPCLWQVAWNYIMFKVPSNLNHSKFLWKWLKRYSVGRSTERELVLSDSNSPCNQLFPGTCLLTLILILLTWLWLLSDLCTHWFNSPSLQGRGKESFLLNWLLQRLQQVPLPAQGWGECCGAGRKG